MKTKKQIRDLLLSILVISVTMLFSFWPDFHPESTLNLSYQKYLDFIFHSTYYFVVTVFCCYIFSIQKLTTYITLFFILIFASVLFETIQIWIPQRTFTLFDIQNNTIGILTGLSINFLFRKLLIIKMNIKYNKQNG